ncbi:MAG: hypothetical protein COV70_02280 [Parcubacteria group bacterium CG11_big_fil_rev_8_21_14_0_20_39_22]|nr:MAG: hypothetical protein COV70_02280 [Parcubacteria group bacterium CG11_big_fil_rev_8_21_14_0_20_39_22]
MLSCLILTSNGLRHAFVANLLQKNFNLVGVVAEEKPVRKSNLQTDIVNHLRERDLVENQYFGSFKGVFDNSNVLKIKSGEVNDKRTVKWILDNNPDYIVLFGSGLIKSEILNIYKDKVINLHLGLSPYYRGTATNFWPIVYGEPECIGATIHLASEEIDGGEILSQKRPDLSSGDSFHYIGCKAIMAGAECLISSIQKYEKGVIKPLHQDLGSGKLFRSSDMSKEAIAIAKINLDNLLLQKYLSNKKYLDSTKPIINQI